MTTYIFNEAGSIPGIPGTFAHCQVDIDEAGNLLALPLARHPAFEASSEAEAAPPVVQEQVPPDLALNLNIN